MACREVALEGGPVAAQLKCKNPRNIYVLIRELVLKLLSCF
jgi:hypothetical protein